MDTVSRISKSFIDDYQVDHCDIIQFSPEIKVLIAEPHHTYDGVTAYFDPHTFERIIHYSSDTICDKCTPEEVMKDNTMLADSRIKTLVVYYRKMKLAGFHVDSAGAFFALGDAKKLPGFGMMRGILIPFDSSRKHMAGFISPIENEQAWVYEDLVE